MSGSDALPVLGRHSSRLRAFRELRTAAQRRRSGAFLLEGPHLFEMLLADLSAGRPIPYRAASFIIDPSYRDRFLERGLDKTCREIGLDGAVVGESVMARLSDTQSPQGVLARIELPEGARDLGSRALALSRRRTLRVVIAEGVGDPGNLGALVRTAAAMGCHLFLTHGGADPFGPKVLRASAGAFLRIPFGEVADPEKVLKALSRAGVRSLATVPRGGVALTQVRPPGRCVVLLGSEAQGLPASWVRHADVRVTIPLQRDVESLNVAVAGSILLYHLSMRPRPAGR